MGVVNLPMGNSLSPTELLAAASRRPFEEVLILGTYADGELRHASTIPAARELWLLRLRELQLLGVIEAATVPRGSIPGDGG